MGLARTNRGTGSIAYTSNSTLTITSGSFTPPVDALLLCLWSEVTTDATPDMVLTATGFTITSPAYLSIVQDDGFGNYAVCRIAYCRVLTSAAGTLVCTRGAGTFTMGAHAEWIEITGEGIAAPVPQYITNVLAGSATFPLNLPSAPAASSMVFTNCIDAGGTTPTVPSGFTALGNFSMGFNSANGEDLASAAQNNDWTTPSTFYAIGVMVEIIEAPIDVPELRYGMGRARMANRVYRM